MWIVASIHFDRVRTAERARSEVNEIYQFAHVINRTPSIKLIHERYVGVVAFMVVLASSCKKLHGSTGIKGALVDKVASMVVLSCSCKKLHGSTSKGALDETNGEKETEEASRSEEVAKVRAYLEFNMK